MQVFQSWPPGDPIGEAVLETQAGKGALVHQHLSGFPASAGNGNLVHLRGQSPGPLAEEGQGRLLQGCHCQPAVCDI